MSSKRKKLLKTLFTANVGCGCSKPKLSDVFDPKPIPKPKTSDFVLQNPNPFSSSSNEEKDEGYTSTTISCNMDNTTATSTTANSESETETRASKMANSIAITMESNNPYRDFKDSMLQMVLEKRIYAKDDLEELLNCFLELNSPCHHYFIVQALTDIWNEVIPKRTGEP